MSPSSTIRAIDSTFSTSKGSRSFATTMLNDAIRLLAPGAARAENLDLPVGGVFHNGLLSSGGHAFAFRGERFDFLPEVLDAETAGSRRPDAANSSTEIRRSRLTSSASAAATLSPARPARTTCTQRAASLGWRQPVQDELAVLLLDEEARPLELPQVLGDGRGGGREDGGHLANAERPAREHRQDARARRVSKSLGGGGDGGKARFCHFVTLRNVGWWPPSRNDVIASISSRCSQPACAGNQRRVATQARQTDSITGTSTRTPTTVARAAPEPGP